MHLNLQTTTIWERNSQAKTRIVINEGSSRSSKTYSLMQFFVVKMLQENNIVITVVRKTGPTLKATVYRDFLEILENLGIYNPRAHNKSDLTYRIRSNMIEFVSVDDFKKVKGRKRDYLFCNEANELFYNEFNQLALRTTKQIFLDYNPSHDDEHWIETKIKIRPDITIIHSTYLDNPFLEPEIIHEIEMLKMTDPNLWRIYGLGIRGIAEARIYQHFKLIDNLPDEFDDEFYSLDFGFNNPSALLHIRVKDKVYYVKELLYQSGLTNNDLILKLNELGVNKNKYIFCDSAEPQRIEEIRRAGYNAYSSDKDVKKGIDTVKGSMVCITKDSLNVLEEYKVYSWKVTSDGKILDEPVKLNDHSMDSLRYGIHTYLQILTKQPNVRVI